MASSRDIGSNNLLGDPRQDGLRVVVRNTFLEFEEPCSPTGGMKRSSSANDVSSTSSSLSDLKEFSDSNRGSESHGTAQRTLAARYGSNVSDGSSRSHAQCTAPPELSTGHVIFQSSSSSYSGSQNSRNNMTPRAQDKIATDDPLLFGEITSRSPIPHEDSSRFARDDAYSSGISAMEMRQSPPSIGSVLHFEGQCKPCHYANMKKGCQHGENCGFCHYTHDFMKRRRPCKEQRNHYKQLIAAVDDDPDPVKAVQQALVQPGTKKYLKKELEKKMRQLQEKQMEQQKSFASSEHPRYFTSKEQPSEPQNAKVKSLISL